MARVIAEYVRNTGETLCQLGPRKTAAFAACCADRLLPMYWRYCSECKWDTRSCMEDALDYVYDALLGRVTTDFLVPVLPSVLDFIPRGSDSESTFFTAARSCALCLEEALRHLLAQPEHPPSSSGYALEALATLELDCPDGVTGFGLTPADERLEAQIIGLPTVQMELVWQRRDIETLTVLDDVSEVIDAMRMTASNNGNVLAHSQGRHGRRHMSG